MWNPSWGWLGFGGLLLEWFQFHVILSPGPKPMDLLRSFLKGVVKLNWRDMVTPHGQLRAENKRLEMKTAFFVLLTKLSFLWYNLLKWKSTQHIQKPLEYSNSVSVLFSEVPFLMSLMYLLNTLHLSCTSSELFLPLSSSPGECFHSPFPSIKILVFYFLFLKANSIGISCKYTSLLVSFQSIGTNLSHARIRKWSFYSMLYFYFTAASEINAQLFLCFSSRDKVPWGQEKLLILLLPIVPAI